MNKRLVGMAALLAGRAKRFHLGGFARLVEEVRRLEPDHILITGDLTTTALPDEFRAAKRAMSELTEAPDRVTVLPGNHDRYTWWAHRSRRFERYFGMFAPQTEYPWLRRLDADTMILDWTRRVPGSRRGRLPRRQMAERNDDRDDRRPSAEIDRGLPLSRGRTTGLRTRPGSQADGQRQGTPGLAPDDRSAPILLRSCPCSLGVPSPRGPRPALHQSRASAAPGAFRPQSSGLRRNPG